MMEPAKLTVDAVTNLAVYGPLGTLAALCIIGMIAMYKDTRKERARHKAELKEKETEHSKELAAERAVFAAERESWRVQLANERKACEDERKEAKIEYQKLEERYITKTENQLEKYNQLTTALKDVMGSAVRRMRPARDSDVGGGRDDT